MKPTTVNIPKNRQVLPNRALKEQDFHFFPMYPSLGFSDRTEDKLRVSEQLYNSIISGRFPTILRWLDSEEPTTIVNSESEFFPANTPNMPELDYTPVNGERDYEPNAAPKFFSSDAIINLRYGYHYLDTLAKKRAFLRNFPEQWLPYVLGIQLGWSEDRTENLRHRYFFGHILWQKDDEVRVYAFNSGVNRPVDADDFWGRFWPVYTHLVSTDRWVFQNPSKSELDINSEFYRNIKVPTENQYVKGKIISSNYSTAFTNKTTGFTSTEGENISYTEQSIEKTIVVHLPYESAKFFFLERKITEGKTELIETIEPNYQRLFFMSPEISGRDVLYITDLRVYRDDTKGGKITHLEITFNSLGDTLRAIGQTLEGYINFAGIGDLAPLPVIHPKRDFTQNPKPSNWDDRFYNGGRYYSHTRATGTNETEPETFDTDTLFPPIPNTKQVYLDNKIELTDKNPAVKYFQIDFNGLFGLSGLQFYGSKKNEEFPLQTSITKPLLISRLIEPLINTHNTSYQNKFRLVSGKIINQNWFKEGIAPELGYFTDPIKARTNLGVLELETGTYRDNNNKEIPSGYSGSEFQLGERIAKKNVELYGLDELNYSKFSDYTLDPKYDSAVYDPETSNEASPDILITGLTDTPKSVNKPDDNGKRIKTNDEGRIKKTFDFLTFHEALNKNTWWTQQLDVLYWEGRRTTNCKSFIQKIVSAGGGILGTIAGAFAGGGAGSAFGALVGNHVFTQIGGTIIDVIPDNQFTVSEPAYRQGTLTNFFIPSFFLDAIYDKLENVSFDDEKRQIPTELFNDENSNYLGGFLNTKIFNSSIAGVLTDTIINEKTNEVHDTKIFLQNSTKELVNEYLIGDDLIANYDNNNTFLINALQIRGLGKVPIRLTFFDKEGRSLWTRTFLPQSGFSGNLLEWETAMLTSDYQDSPSTKTKSYKEQIIDQSWASTLTVPEKRGQTPIEKATKLLKDKKRASGFEYIGPIISRWVNQTYGPAGARDWYFDHSTGQAPYDFALIENVEDLINLDEEIVNGLKVLHPNQANTKKQQIQLLLNTYKYKLNVSNFELYLHYDFYWGPNAELFDRGIQATHEINQNFQFGSLEVPQNVVDIWTKQLKTDNVDEPWSPEPNEWWPAEGSDTNQPIKRDNLWTLIDGKTATENPPFTIHRLKLWFTRYTGWGAITGEPLFEFKGKKTLFHLHPILRTDFYTTNAKFGYGMRMRVTLEK